MNGFLRSPCARCATVTEGPGSHGARDTLEPPRAANDLPEVSLLSEISVHSHGVLAEDTLSVVTSPPGAPRCNGAETRDDDDVGIRRRQDLHGGEFVAPEKRAPERSASAETDGRSTSELRRTSTQSALIDLRLPGYCGLRIESRQQPGEGQR